MVAGRAVLWDLDGTLVDSEPLHARATDEELAAMGLSTPAGFHDRALGLPAERVHEKLVAEAGLGLSPVDWEKRKFARFASLSSSLKVRNPAALLAARLAERGVAQAVVSNSTRAEVDLALHVTGLGKSIAHSVARDDVSHGKPDPEGYLAAAARLGVTPADCLAVEDSATGATAALAAGMAVIFHPQHSDEGPAEAIALPPDGDLEPLIETFIFKPEAT